MEFNNDGPIRICWIKILGYNQFQDVFLDFQHPETGEPLDKICLIGANGTGKTVLLKLIERIVLSILNENVAYPLRPQIAAKIILNDTQYLFITGSGYPRVFISFSNSLAIEGKKAFEFIENNRNRIFNTDSEDIQLHYQLPITEKANTLIITIPSESSENKSLSLRNVPQTSLAAAIKQKNERNFFHTISNDTIVNFWNNLIYKSHERREAQQRFETMPENLDKTKRELLEVFDKENPKIFEKLADIWDRILGKAGLELDLENAVIPFQPEDNLKAYIRLKNSKEKIPYSQLSSGIRNYIFRLGHIFSLYFNRKVSSGLMLVDEPENGLYPDFLYDLIDEYREVARDMNGEINTQMFFATHEPIIAAQFEPYERIILEWNDDGTVRARKGVSPIGDDPNDLLKKDFGVATLMGEEGNEAWKHYRQLKNKIATETDPEKKMQFTEEYLRIGRAYNFPAK